VRAFRRGLEETISNPDEAFEISKLYVEGLEAANISVQRDILKGSIKFWTAERIGYSDPLAWKNMQNVLIEMGLLQEEVDLAGAYTNEFLE
jgi:NitT/TauT family transport system substrate-binding protein